MFKPNRILVPVDFSKVSLTAIQGAVMIAKANPGCTLYLAHIQTPVGGWVSRENIPMTYVDEEIQAANNRLKELQKEIPSEIPSSLVLREGHVPAEVKQLCSDLAIDLLVMATHGRHGLSHLLQGSITEETVRTAPCPVLVLHMNQQLTPLVPSDERIA